MSLIENLLKQQSDRIEALEKRLSLIESKPVVPNAAPVAVLEPRAAADVAGDVLNFVTRHWDKTHTPLQMRFLSQSMSRACKRAGGLQTILDSLEQDKKIKVLQMHAGATLIFPFATYATIPRDVMEKMLFAGMSEKQISRMKARNALYFNALSVQGPSEKELADANAYALASLKKEI